jgi:hypothetical protein
MFLHFVLTGRLHRLRLFAFVCESLVYGLLVAPSVLLTLFAQFIAVVVALVVALIPYVWVVPCQLRLDLILNPEAQFRSAARFVLKLLQLLLRLILVITFILAV